MKNIIKILVLLIFITSCRPEDFVNLPESNLPPKISAVKLIKLGDTTTYTFQYNEDTTKLTTVLRNGEWYSTITYALNQAVVVMDKGNIYHDSFLVKLSPNAYIDSINSLVPELISFGEDKMYSSTRGVNNILYESDYFLDRYIQYQDNVRQTHLAYMEHDSTNDNLNKFYVQVTERGQSYSYRDSLDYSSRIVNQPNLPDQFVTSLQSFRLYQGVPILNPLFLLQQSNIYPYRSHTNLINNWQTFEVDLTLAPVFYSKTEYNYNYNYIFDGLSRVIQMDVYVNSELYLTYLFEYFD